MPLGGTIPGELTTAGSGRFYITPRTIEDAVHYGSPPQTGRDRISRDGERHTDQDRYLLD